MAEKILLEVVTPENKVVSEDVNIVMSPGIEGEFGVLPGHTPYLTTLKTGALHYKDANNAEKNVFVSGGFAEALPTKVTVLAESAELKEDIDVDRAKASKKRAEERLAKPDEDIDQVRARAALLRATQRLNMAL